MIRKIATGLMLSAFAGALVMGCGKADLTEGQTAWTQRADEVKAKLADVQTMYNDLRTQHSSMQTADMTPENQATYETASATLSAQETTLQSVSEALAAQDQALTAALETGDQAAFDEAWAAAQKIYDEEVNKLEAVSSNLNTVASAVQGMSAPNMDTAATGDQPADATTPETDASDTGGY